MNNRIKMLLDCVMIVLLPVLMAYSLVGEEVHEWVGVVMFLLFLAHHILNWNWYRGLGKGRWRARRILQTAVNVALLVCMLMLMFSGIVLSRYVFDFLPISGGHMLARMVHMLGGYWGFCIMSLHLGIHWNMVLGMVRKGRKEPSHTRTWILQGLVLLMVAYGLFAFFHRDIPDYLFLRSHFVFFDFEEPLVLFFLDYLAIMALFTVLGHHAVRLLTNRKHIATACMITVLCVMFLNACGTSETIDNGNVTEQSAMATTETVKENNIDTSVEQNTEGRYTADTLISEVVNDPVFGNYGRLIFPVHHGYYSGDTLEELQLTWYSNIDSDKTVEITNYMKDHAEAGETIFYDIYTDEEKAIDPAKEDTGIFFFKGNPGERFAVCNAGGGNAYVGAMHDSFPHALELSKMGYNSFALIYRPGTQTACEDLARALSFIFEHADELEVNTDGYSLWGGSAGARVAAYLGSYGSIEFGGDDLPQPGTVVMQYTGHSDYAENDPPTYVCVGTDDGIANWRTMEQRIQRMDALGIATEFHVYEGIGHGFGLGTGTVAEGWIKDAVVFWETQVNTL